MMNPFWSLLLCLVLICGLQLAICHNYIHDAYISLHITHIIANHNNNVYSINCNFNIYIQDICKYCHDADNQL